MSRESALLGLLADLVTDRDALIAQRDALQAEVERLHGLMTQVDPVPAPEGPPKV